LKADLSNTFFERVLLFLLKLPEESADIIYDKGEVCSFEDRKGREQV